MLRRVLFVLLVTAATTGLGVSIVFGAIGAAYMAHGIRGLIDSNNRFEHTGG